MWDSVVGQEFPAAQTPSQKAFVLRYFVGKLVHPTGFEPVTPAFGVQEIGIMGDGEKQK